MDMYCFGLVLEVLGWLRVAFVAADSFGWVVADGFGWLQMVSGCFGWFWMVLGGFGWFAVLVVMIVLNTILVLTNKFAIWVGIQLKCNNIVYFKFITYNLH